MAFLLFLFVMPTWNAVTIPRLIEASATQLLNLEAMAAPAGRHSHAEKLKALEWKDEKSFEISSSQALAADAAESLRLKEIDYFHSSASCDHQENRFQNQDVAGNFDVT